jgi:hypothetical protein
MFVSVQMKRLNVDRLKEQGKECLTSLKFDAKRRSKCVFRRTKTDYSWSVEQLSEELKSANRGKDGEGLSSNEGAL